MGDHLMMRRPLMSIFAMPWRFTALLAVVSLGSLSAVFSAQPVALDRYESRFYTLYSNLPLAEARRYGGHMDLVFNEFQGRFQSFRDRRRGRQNLYLFRTRQDYINQMGAFGVKAGHTGGMFFRRNQASGLATYVGDQSDQRVFAVLQHEGFHQFAANYIGDRLPRWANEGLAEYFGQAVIVNRKVRLGNADARRLATIRTAITDGTVINFDDLLNITAHQWHENVRSGSDLGYLQYVQSWSIVHFLIHGDKGRYQRAFGQYLNLLSRGWAQTTAFERAFDTSDTSGFQQRWLEYVQQLKPDSYSAALSQMEFLGSGLRALDRESLGMPTTIDQLKSVLQERQFQVTRMSHAGPIMIEATDESLYHYLAPDGQENPFELKEGQKGFPPSIGASGLRPAPSIQWKRDKQNKLTFKIVYR